MPENTDLISLSFAYFRWPTGNYTHYYLPQTHMCVVHIRDECATPQRYYTRTPLSERSRSNTTHHIQTLASVQPFCSYAHT